MGLQIDWASLIVGSKFTVFVLFYFVFEGTFPGDLYLEGRFKGGSFCVTGLGGLYLEGLIHGGLIFGILLYVLNSYLATVVREKVECESKAWMY